MDLIQLIQKLVDDPEALATFKADPDAYIANYEKALQPYLRTLLRQPIFFETGTVMTIKKSSGASASVSDTTANQLSAIPDGAVNLEGVPVVIQSRASFFAEYTGVQSFLLLPHSYADITQQKVNFLLNLCYVDPKDEHDQPQLLVIKGGDPDYKPSTYNLANTMIQLTIRAGSYILVRGDSNIDTRLQKDSYYHSTTEGVEFALIIDRPNTLDT